MPDEELAGEPDAPDRLVDPAGVGPKFWFQKVPEAKTVKNRLHLDLTVSGGRSAPPARGRRAAVEAEVARLSAAGASAVRVVDDPVSYFVVPMHDPEGNEFCVC